LAYTYGENALAMKRKFLRFAQDDDSTFFGRQGNNKASVYIGSCAVGKGGADEILVIME
jgi:hypothetical protein